MWIDLRKYTAELVVVLICLSAIALLAFALAWRSYWLAYEVFIPSSTANAPRPALVMLHGRSGDTSVLRAWLGFEEFAEQRGFIVIYPQSHQGAWNFGVGVRERGHVGRRYIDHVRYIQAIVDEVDALHPIDRDRLFLAGVSDGASMAVHASCMEPDAFQGLISVAATIPYYAVDDCPEPRPLSALLIHGVQDSVMLWEGRTYRQYKVFLSLEESVRWWAERNHCNSKQAEQQGYVLLVGQVDVRFLEDCEDGTEVLVYRVNDGGHTWPGRDHPQNRTVGKLNRDIDATKIIADWISRTKDGSLSLFGERQRYFASVLHNDPYRTDDSASTDQH